MAERFGGKFSPTPPATDGSDIRAAQAPADSAPFRGRRRSRIGGRVNVLFFVPVVFLFTAFKQPPVGMAVDLAAFATLVLSAWMTRLGLEAQEAYDARSVARRPAIPRKLFGSALTGIGLGLGAWTANGGLLVPLLFTAIGFVVHVAAFGPDPMRDKGMEGIDRYQSDRVARAVTEGEGYLAAMKDAIRRAGDRQLEARVERFQTTAREMFRTVEEDPRDLVAARRYMGVYLMGARDATVKFADIWARSRDQKARSDYEALLDDLEKNFSSQTRALLEDDRSALDIEIDVLRERLQREGIRSEA